MARILLVDDSPIILRQLRQFLEACGHTVVGEARDGNAALALYGQHAPDLVLMDLTMPSMDGRATLRDLLAREPRARIVIVSAIRDRNTILECLNAGALDYIEKPLRFQDEAFRTLFSEVVTRSSLEAQEG